MKKYETIEIQICVWQSDDIIRTSGEVDGDETKYPIPGVWTE